MPFSVLVLAAATAALSPEFVVDLKEAYPALSPDGATLLFQTNRSGRWAIHTARADGKDSKALIDSGDDPVTPSWSADGQRIAYAASVDGQSEIFVADSDGSNRQRLTRDPGDDMRRVVFGMKFAQCLGQQAIARHHEEDSRLAVDEHNQHGGHACECAHSH